MQLRSGEQNLHRDSAPTPATGGLFSGAICSPLLASPCSSVPGSKFFTQIPRRRPRPAGFSKARFALPSPLTLYFRFPGANLGPGISGFEARRPAWFALTFPQALCFRFPGANRRPGPAGFSKARFAPPSPRALAAPSRGANSSHKFRASVQKNHPRVKRGVFNDRAKPMLFALRVQRVI